MRDQKPYEGGNKIKMDASIENARLKVFVFYWTNTRMGYRTPKGGKGLFYPVEKSMVIAPNKKEAKMFFRTQEKKFKETVRQQTGGHKTSSEIEKILKKICYKSGLAICEFPLKRGLVI